MRHRRVCTRLLNALRGVADGVLCQLSTLAEDAALSSCNNADECELLCSASAEAKHLGLRS